MKKLFVAAALGLGLLFTPAVNAQTPAPAVQPTAHQTTTNANTAKATQTRDAKGHFTKTGTSAKTTAKSSATTAKPATARQRDDKGRFVKADASKPATAKGTQSRPRDAKGRYVKTTGTTSPTTK